MSTNTAAQLARSDLEPKATDTELAAVTTTVTEDDEPQNALTRKFTEKEWAALKDFRPLLPDILEKAYDGKEGARTTPIVIWGVELDPNRKKDARASVVLMKWLRARNLNVNEAKTMMIATLRWRDEFKIEEAMKETYPDVFNDFGHVYGRDKEGRPIVYNIYGGKNDLATAFSDVQRFIRWRVALMEHGIKLINFETVDQMIQVHDYEGASLSGRTANSKAAASELTSIFQNHYPEFLARKFFVNVPSIMTWIFWLFKPVLSPATIAKMKSSATARALSARNFFHSSTSRSCRYSTGVW
ncbi:CRAL-TRIO domain-containing protein [Multifurca ochricompacta]|uniref:Phosphatidylinositol transfer protein SFH5 n=1 Tax=Multifurca ochricompacta TaxID=376703 RepID=A0AAD4M9L6_9AGAM|nr:CRAL-TRIO domain-containing protein [Multifurca ochricompacta]